jgi:hypothetical protein
MKNFPTLSIFAVVAFVLAAPAFAAEPENNAVKMPDSHVTRTIDCDGRDLTVTGDDNKLTVKRCSTISVVGDHNQMTAELLPASTIAALGNHNHIVFVHAPGFEVQVTSSGAGNEVVPVMTRDSNDVSPVKFPITPR